MACRNCVARGVEQFPRGSSPLLLFHFVVGVLAAVFELRCGHWRGLKNVSPENENVQPLGYLRESVCYMGLRLTRFASEFADGRAGG